MRRPLVPLLLAIIALTPISGQAAVEQAMASVVSVLPVWPANASRSEEPEGSGVAVGDGRTVLTADHVIGPATEVFVRSHEGVIWRAEITARDPETDLAVLSLPEALPALEFAPDPRPGEPVCAIGNGFGLGITVACGVVSAIRQTDTGFNAIEDSVQTDAAVNPGMSGGALVDSEGRLAGILSGIFTKTSDANIGVNFAVSAGLAAAVLADLAPDGTIDRPGSGLTLRRDPPPGTEGQEAAAVVSVAPGSPEAAAGIKPGDRILQANGRSVRKPGTVTAATALLGAGGILTLVIERGGEQQTIEVEFAR